MPRTSADNVSYCGDQSASGYVIGTGAVITMIIGWCPKRVELRNTEGNCYGVWIKNMDNGSIQKVVDSGSGTTDISLETSNGITIIEADDFNSSGVAYGGMGFLIGADTDLNVSGEDIFWFAER